MYGVTFENSRNFVNGLVPYGSGVERAVDFLTEQGLMSGHVFQKVEGEGKSRLNFSAEAIQQTIQRIAIFTFVLPLIASLGAVYNVAGGVAHLGLLATAIYLKKERVDQQNELKTALLHFAAAIHDVAIAFFLSMQKVGSLVALAMALYPRVVVQGESLIFKGQQVKQTAEDESEEEETVTTNPWIERGAGRVTQAFLPTTPETSLVDRIRTLFGYTAKA